MTEASLWMRQNRFVPLFAFRGLAGAKTSFLNSRLPHSALLSACSGPDCLCTSGFHLFSARIEPNSGREVYRAEWAVVQNKADRFMTCAFLCACKSTVCFEIQPNISVKSGHQGASASSGESLCLDCLVLEKASVGLIFSRHVRSVQALFSA